jgi:hypothetical protein
MAVRMIGAYSDSTLAASFLLAMHSLRNFFASSLGIFYTFFNKISSHKNPMNQNSSSVIANILRQAKYRCFSANSLNT